MKRTANWAVIALLAFSSCAKEFNYNPTEEINENAQNIFGIIDPSQDWHTYTSGTVSITADADLDDIAKVQILTESPFFNDNAKILAEADATAGQTLTLNYDAPRGTETLIAACVDKSGHHFIKPFDLNTKQVSFATTTANTRGMTRADDNIDVSGLKLDASTARWSINSVRTIFANLAESTGNATMKSTCTNNHFGQWANSNWENEMVWELSSSSTIAGWTIEEGALVRNIDDMSADEKATVKAIFDSYLSRQKYKDGTKEDNMEDIREGSAVKFFNNHLTSDGLPITLIPVQTASTDLKYYDIYYYYYNTTDVPDGMSEAEYIKQLPKFKAMNCPYTQNAAYGISEKFFKIHEYLLPYYGDNDLMTSGECTTDGKVYRIRNAEINAKDNKSYYLTYLNGKVGMGDDKMSQIYQDNNANIANQLWQLFTTSDNRQIIYNVGSGMCLIAANDYVSTNDYWGVFYTDYMPAVKRNSLYMEKNDDGSCYFWYDLAKTRMLGSNINKSGGTNYRVATNKTLSDKGQVKWYLDEYTAGNVEKIEKLVVEGEPQDNNKAISAIIPKGYRVGFMMRRIAEADKYMRSEYNGCIWGYGELNTLINQTPKHFGKAVNEYSMELNDPRIAMFNANNKTYLSIEDGNDCNFSDMIVEVTGKSGSMFDDVQEVGYDSFTMCFEDRPNVADYDMNDVVLRCTRKSATEIELSLIAAGANDNVYIYGINGNCTGGTDLNEKEVHALFGVSTDTFVNTEKSADVINSISATYEVSGSTTIPQFLSSIYIRNMSQGGNEIHVPNMGDAPFALIIPGDFDYPIERTSIVNAYTTFRTWANNANNYAEWLDSYDSSKIYTNPYKQ